MMIEEGVRACWADLEEPDYFFLDDSYQAKVL